MTIEKVEESFNLFNFINESIKKENNVIINDRKFPTVIPLDPALDQIIKTFPPNENIDNYSFTIKKNNYNIPTLFTFYKKEDSIVPYLNNAKLCFTRYVNPARKEEFMLSKSNRKKILDEAYFNDLSKEDRIIVTIEYNVKNYLDSMKYIHEQLVKIANFSNNNNIHDFYNQKYEFNEKEVKTNNITINVSDKFYTWNPETNILSLQIYNQHGVSNVLNFTIGKIPYIEKDALLSKVKFPEQKIPIINLANFSITENYFTKIKAWNPTFYVNRIYYYEK
jgi:hypothetical protein